MRIPVEIYEFHLAEIHDDPALEPGDLLLDCRCGGEIDVPNDGSHDLTGIASAGFDLDGHRHYPHGVRENHEVSEDRKGLFQSASRICSSTSSTQIHHGDFNDSGSCE